jgi:hypothetical protein
MANMISQGTNMIFRKLAKIIEPTVIINYLGNERWHFKMKTHIKDLENEFVIGKEIEEEMADCRKVKVTGFNYFIIITKTQIQINILVSIFN